MKTNKEYIKLNKNIIEGKDLNTILDIKNDIDNLYQKEILLRNLCENLSVKNKLSFGNIKHAFDGMLSELFKTKKGRLKINEFIETITSNKSLTNTYLLYEEIYNPSNIDDTNIFLNEIKNLIGNVNKDEINNGINKLFNIVKESINCIDINNININDLISEKYLKVNESINYIINNNKTIKNLSTYSSNVNNIISFINEQKSHINNTIADNLCEKFANEIKTSVKNITESNNFNTNETKFETYKKDCIDTIDSICENTNSEMQSKLINVKNKLLEKKFNQETFDDDIANLIELKNTLLE